VYQQPLGRAESGRILSRSSTADFNTQDFEADTYKDAKGAESPDGPVEVSK
jgi:hypothetical protein